MTNAELNQEEVQFLNDAAQFFSNPGMVSKSLTWIGKPIEAAHDRLPARVRNGIAKATDKAIKKAMVAAVATIPKTGPHDLTASGAAAKSGQSSLLHRGLATLTGAVGGVFGLPALAIELPLTTVLILRGISDQAQLHGHDLNDLETRLECLMVFSLGTSNPNDDATNSAYFATRTGFAKLVQSASAFAINLSAKEFASAVEKGTAPVLIKLISQVAKTFQVRVAQKFLAESVPVVGAIGGGFLNYAFTEFFVTAAKFHFGVRALEKKYSAIHIQDQLKQRMSVLGQPHQ